jgi:ABC-type transport system involved in cytochrome c biogenesis ATPase subunit
VDGLTGRRAERGALDSVVDAVLAGRGPVLVVRGDPGVGKTVLLEYLAGRARGAGCRLARAAGVQSEMELMYAGLHQLCGPMLSRAERLPGRSEMRCGPRSAWLRGRHRTASCSGRRC